MNLTRSRAAAVAALLTAAFFVFSVGSAQAQSGRMKATIPFGFYAGDTLLPAGTYQVEQLGSGVAKLQSADRKAAIMFHTIHLTNPVRDFGSGKLVFNRYGDDTFLSEMWWSGPEGLKPIQSKRERELASVRAPVRIAIARQ